MKRFAFLLGMLLVCSISQAQQIDAERLTAWENAGLSVDLEAPQNQVNMLDMGADITGNSSSNMAYNAAISALNGQAGTIFFPAGDYFFDQTINVPNSVFLKGESSATELHFNLGDVGHSIQFNGSVEETEMPLLLGGIKGTNQLELSEASGVTEGDIIRLFMFDEDLMFSSWAYGTLGQVVEVLEINGNSLTLADPLNHNFPLSRMPYVKKLNPVRAAGIECLSIFRDDDPLVQVSNIYLNSAFNCVVRNVESNRCGFAHVEVNSSAHINMEGNFFHHGVDYGDGGRAYGVAVQTASSFCLIQNNVFEHLRHSMLLQSGANGNVFGYNFSTDAFWVSGTLPTNAGGDAVLHGNYPYMNLFEGNTLQQIVVDASHGNNGPFNTFLRNRLELYGFISDNAVVTDSMNVIGNETIGTAFPFGIFSLNGEGHLSHGNNIAGVATPVGTDQVDFNTLYLEEEELPDFFGGDVPPMVGFPLDTNEKTLNAEVRFNNGEPVSCDGSLITSQSSKDRPDNFETVRFFSGRLLIDESMLPAIVTLYSLDGRLVKQMTTDHPSTQFLAYPLGGIFILRVTAPDQGGVTLKVVLTE